MPVGDQPGTTLTSLAEMFALQDGASKRNWAEASAEFALIERGLMIGWSATLLVNDEITIAKRKAKAEVTMRAETIGANLLHAALSSLVNAARLTLCGAHVDALSLARGAFESTYHAEYFRDHPDDAVEWDRAGLETDVYKIADSIRKFEERKQVRRTVAGKYSDPPEVGESLHRLFKELSTYGSHANPQTVVLRLASDRPGVANLGFVSIGKSEATRLCANHVLHLVGYVLSEFSDYFAEYLDGAADFVGAYEQFRHDHEGLRQREPGRYSLLR
jgi:hypothetical protein